MESIDDYGKEIYYSKYFKKYLEIHHIYVIKILKRYYYWFLKSKV